jgi:hypothetical protein
MKVPRLPRLVVALALASLAPVLHATSVIQPTFNELVGTADYVVRAVVTSTESSWREDSQQPGERYIGSRIALDVREVIQGTPPSPLVLEVVGGRVGDEELVIDGTPKLVPGREYILFIRGNGRVFFPVVGLAYGTFPIRRDTKTGRSEVHRANGQPLYSTQDLAPGTASTARSATARPMTPDSFRNRIRETHGRTLER